MSIAFVRIDDRLIHGQVATTWVKNYAVEQIAVLDDRLAQDPMQSSLIKMTAPAGVNAVLLTIDQFVAAYQTGFKKKTMIICTNPIDVVRLLKNDVPIPKLNVGGMKYTLGKQKLTKAISVTDQDIEAFRQLLQAGTEVEIQMVPNSVKEPITNYIN